MSPRGSIEINWLVAAALALIALLIMAFIFREQVSHVARSLLDITPDPNAVRQGDQCNDFLQDRKCYQKSCTEVEQAARAVGDAAFFRVAPYPPNGMWKDCSKPEFCCVRKII